MVCTVGGLMGCVWREEAALESRAYDYKKGWALDGARRCGLLQKKGVCVRACKSVCARVREEEDGGCACCCLGIGARATLPDESAAAAPKKAPNEPLKMHHHRRCRRTHLRDGEGLFERPCFSERRRCAAASRRSAAQWRARCETRVSACACVRTRCATTCGARMNYVARLCE
jgi:hypothetical protein